METAKKTLNELSTKGGNKGGKLNEGQEKGNNKVVTSPKPAINPAPQKPTKK